MVGRKTERHIHLCQVVLTTVSETQLIWMINCLHFYCTCHSHSLGQVLTIRISFQIHLFQTDWYWTTHDRQLIQMAPTFRNFDSKLKPFFFQNNKG